MNIFVLDSDPTIAAKYQCDKHIVKMCLETAQLLCSVFSSAPYKRTHYNHPCSVWTRESLGNYQWLISHGESLCKEYTNRYGKVHKSQSVIEWCSSHKDELIFKNNRLTQHPLCMPDECKTESVVESYRSYYIRYKKDFAVWKNVEIPYWYNL